MNVIEKCCSSLLLAETATSHKGKVEVIRIRSMYEDSRVLDLALNLPPRADIWEYGRHFWTEMGN